MTDETTPEVGLFSRVENTRTVRGLLLPFGELSRPSLSKTEPVMFSAAAVSLPRDPSAITLNDEHSQFAPIGRATELEVTEGGIVASFSIFDTDEGDAYLANPTKRKLSAEFGSLVRNGANAVRSRLTGAAVCTEGAFESAALFSLAEGVEAEETTDEPTPKTTDAAPVAEEIPNDSQEEVMTAAAAGQIPAPLATPGVTAPVAQEVDLRAVFSAMANLKGGAQVEDSEKALMALADIRTTDVAAGVIQPDWVGKLWQGKRYTRRYIDLVTHTYGGMSLGGRKGFKINQGTALVAKRGGQKTELPTGSSTFSTAESSRESYGFAADIAREWFDLSGGAEVLQAFWEGVVDSYAELTDNEALATLFRVASRGTGAALSRRIAPASLPAGTPANSQYSPAAVALIQAVEEVSDRRDEAAWAVVNPTAWNQLIYTPRDILPEYVSLDVNVGEGTASVDGKVSVRKAPQSFFPGTSATAPQIIAGSKAAIEFKEQGQTPIQIDAADVAKHGLDRAIVGYLETFVVREESTVFIGTAA